MSSILETLTSLSKECETDATKYGQDIVHICEFNSGKTEFMAWIPESEKQAAVGFPSPNSLEEATKMLNDATVGILKCLHLKTFLVDNLIRYYCNVFIYKL